MKPVKSIVTVAVVVFVAAAFIGAGGDGSKKTQKVTLKVEGMTCAGCARRVENAVKQIQGVEKVQVDLDEGKAKVELKNGTRVAPDSLAAAITRAGYKASVLEEKNDDRDNLPTGPSCCPRGPTRF